LLRDMKWVPILALVALAAFATAHAEGGVVVDGVEYVESSDAMMKQHLQDVFDAISTHREKKGISSLSHDGSREYSESEVNEFNADDYGTALAFIATHSEFRNNFLGDALQGLKQSTVASLDQAKFQLQEQALRQLKDMIGRGFNTLPPNIQQLIRDIAGSLPGMQAGAPGAPGAPGAAKAAAKVAAPSDAPMDPFAAKHYNKGFVPGSLGRPSMMAYKMPASHVTARLVEDCMACRFIWKNVESDAGNTEMHKTVYDSFINHCRRGMTAPLMYQPCQTMFGSLDDMISGYVSGLQVDEICAQARMCR